MSAEADELLYHYTSTDSFLSILDSGEMWASHIRYLNDTSEQRLAWRQLKARLLERLESAVANDREHLETLKALVENPLELDMYILSFAQDAGDRLSQ
jgi:hypothetical protein